MNNTLNVRPAEGMQVRTLNGTVIPAEGCTVPNTSYYRRRLRDGDLVAVETETDKKGAK